MSEKIVQLNEEVIKGQLKELVRGSVEETLNELLEAGGRSVPRGQIPEMYRPLLPECILCNAPFQGETGGQNA